ncbi:MAG TPA: Ig-like domain-containing protein [Planctomycetota bacterium]|nr:Ig-like domain-containing protein [Planctomycetota bacterium]
MKPARIGIALIAVVLIGCALTAFFLLRDRTPHGEVDAELNKPDAPIAAPITPKETIETPQFTAEETGARAAAVDTQRQEADAHQLEIFVVDPSNAPVADAKLAIFREGKLLAEFVTPSDGLARFRDLEGTAEYAIAAPSWEIARGTLELGTGRRTLALADGAVVAGTVIVDGGAPPEAFELWWQSDKAQDAAPLPPAVAKSLRGKLSKRAVATTRTNADGTFMIRGVRPQAAGFLSWSARYFLPDAENEYSARQLSFDGPRRDLVLELSEGCELRLRVVDAAGAPVPQANVSLRREIKNADGTSTSTDSSAADAEGRYSKIMRADAVATFVATVAGPNSAATKAYPLTRPAVLRGVWDAGDLTILATRTISVLVQDEASKPVSGARIYAWPGTFNSERPKTDDSGRLDVDYNPESPAIAVEAFGFLSTAVAVPSEATEVTVTLERATLLEFELEAPSSEAQGLTLELHGPTPMFVDEDLTTQAGQAPTRPRTLRGESGRWGTNTGSEGTSANTSASKDGRWRVSGLLPNQPLRAKLLSAGEALCEVEISPLSRGEQRKQVLRIGGNGKSLIVRVLAPSGEPHRGAVIYTVQGMNGFSGHGVDSNGELKLTGLYGERCILDVNSEVYAPKRVCLQPIPDGRYDVKLEPAQSLEVELVQPDGAPYVGSADFQANIGGPARLHRTTLAPGRYRLDPLPRGDVLIEVNGSFNAIVRMHHAGDSPLRIVVGEPGRISVMVTGDLSIASGTWMVAAGPTGAQREITRASIRVTKEGLGAVKAGSGLASIDALAPGSYDLWLVRCSDPANDDWVPVGLRARAVIDAEHPVGSVALSLPD